jgi:hypothetical protein
MLPGYSPTDRPQTDGEYQMFTPPEVTGRKKSAVGVWVTLAVVIALMIGAVMLLSLVPEPTATTTSVPLPNAPVG